MGKERRAHPRHLALHIVLFHPFLFRNFCWCRCYCYCYNFFLYSLCVIVARVLVWWESDIRTFKFLVGSFLSWSERTYLRARTHKQTKGLTDTKQLHTLVWWRFGSILYSTPLHCYLPFSPFISRVAEIR